jgi:putative hydrolase of the HAD superfamily
VIRAVISDFGGVLTSPLIESFMAYQDESGVRFEDLGRAMMRVAEKHGEHPLFELEKGRITEAEFLAMLEAELDGDVHLGSLRDTYFAHLRPNEPMIAFMRELRGRGLRMALLTNNVREWEPHWRAKLPELDEIFEVVVDSAFVGMRKPDPAIYSLCVERIGDGVAASECVFVDDNDVNVEAAAALGMAAVRFESSEQARADIEGALDGGQ